MKKGMLFSLSHRDERFEKMNLQTFFSFYFEKFPELELPEPSTDFIRA